MEMRVLGAVEAYHGGRRLSLGPPQQRLILAAFAAEVGQVVSAEALIDKVWDQAPGHARRTLYVHITHIRRLLESTADTPDRAVTGGPPQPSAPAPAVLEPWAAAGRPEPAVPQLVRRSGGYVFDLDPARVDVHRFRQLLALGSDPAAPACEAAARLREAIGLWQGEPLLGLTGRWAARTRLAWRQEYLEAMAELGAGRDSDRERGCGHTGAHRPVRSGAARGIRCGGPDVGAARQWPDRGGA